MPRAQPMPADERRAALVAATEPLLELHGRNVSTRQIAEAAGIAEGTIFRVFPTKEALIDAVIADAFDVQITCDAIARVEAGLDLESRLVAVADIIQLRLRRVFALFHSLTLTQSPEPREAFHTKVRQDNAALNTAIAAVIDPDRDQLTVDPDAAASLLRTLTFSATHPILSDQRHSSPEQIVGVLLHGIIKPSVCCATSDRSDVPLSLEGFPC
ncbi:MAG TPA: TetR/AcrR family transcriptional regulator [Propionibacteriaceae bacterium]|nr:TetR/AcrR family transcriptional regulator [Propionibacteriaceae bacterium]